MSWGRPAASLFLSSPSSVIVGRASVPGAKEAGRYVSAVVGGPWPASHFPCRFGERPHHCDPFHRCRPVAEVVQGLVAEAEPRDRPPRPGGPPLSFGFSGIGGHNPILVAGRRGSLPNSLACCWQLPA